MQITNNHISDVYQQIDGLGDCIQFSPNGGLDVSDAYVAGNTLIHTNVAATDKQAIVYSNVNGTGDKLTFVNNTVISEGLGLWCMAGMVEITGNIFTSDAGGLNVECDAVINGNVFTCPSSYAIRFRGAGNSCNVRNNTIESCLNGINIGGTGTVLHEWNIYTGLTALVAGSGPVVTTDNNIYPVGYSQSEPNSVNSDIVLDANYMPVVGSVSIGNGVKWWGNEPRPSGYGGEPYPDTAIDIGGVQSTYNAQHPANI